MSSIVYRYLVDENGMLQLLRKVGKGVVSFEAWVSAKGRSVNTGFTKVYCSAYLCSSITANNTVV